MFYNDNKTDVSAMEVTTTHGPAIEKDNVETILYNLRIVWIIGIATSCLALVVQLFLLLLIPRCRKFDEKVLVNLTATRIVNTMCEYYFLNQPPQDTAGQRFLLDTVFVLGFYTDFILVSWMFVFTKNLYDKVTAVFILDKLNFMIITLIIWLSSLPIAIIFLIMVKYAMSSLKYYYMTYYCFKFLILLTNALFFIRIFHVAKSRGRIRSNRNLKDIIRTTVAAFILVLANVLQVSSTDFVVVFLGENRILAFISSVLNSFHAIPLMIIFVLVVRAKLRGPILRTLSSRLTTV